MGKPNKNPEKNKLQFKRTTKRTGRWKVYAGFFALHHEN